MPTYDADTLDVNRQMRLAQALQQAGSQPLPGQMVSGIYVPPSPMQYAAQALQTYKGTEEEKKALQRQKELEAAKQQEIADILRNYGRSDVGPMSENERMMQEARLQQLDPNMAKVMEARQNREDIQASRLEQMRLANELKASQAQAGGNAYYQPLQTANGVFAFNARTGKVEQVQGPGGQPVVGAQFNPQLQQQLAASKGVGQEQAKLTGQTLEHAKDAKESNALLDQVEQAGAKATGSGLGHLRDVAGNVVGYTTEGAKNAAQLNVLGASLVAKVPKMSGPQSDRDADMYKKAAGNIADPNVPWEQKQASIAVMREINNRQIAYAEGRSPQSPAPKTLRFDAQGNLIQ